MPAYRDPKAPYWTILERAEAAMIRDALRASNGNVKAAAEALGIARNYFHKRIKRFGISRDEYLTPPIASVTELPPPPPPAQSASWLEDWATGEPK